MCTLGISNAVHNSHTTQRANIRALVWVCLWACVVCGELRNECPNVCECKWKDGKETVTCIGAEFIDIPRLLDPSTQVLDLKHNNLQILPKDAFVDTGLVNLQKLWLTYCNLKHMDRGAFNMLANLVELDLSHNQLRAVPSAALTDIPGLRELRLARNAITAIHHEAFTPTPDLVRLDLSFNRINTLDKYAFRGLSSLEVLKLSSNLLVHISQEILLPLMALHGLHLNNNPWHCDCHLRPLRQWMVDHNIAGIVPASCARPRRLSGRSWHVLALDEFVCTPEVTALAPRVLTTSGENISLACRVDGDMEAEVIWLFGDRPLLNSSDAWRFKSKKLVDNSQKAFFTNLTIQEINKIDQGTYKCVAKNKAGRAESNLTIQVSQEITEHPLVDFETAYMTGGLLSGLGFLVTLLLLVSCVVHRRQRVRKFRREEEYREGRALAAAASTQATSIAATKPHKEKGGQGNPSQYEIVPSNDIDESPEYPHRSIKSWRHRDTANGDYDHITRYREDTIDDLRGHRLSPSTISYVELPPTELSRRCDLGDKISLKNLEFETDILRRECSPSGSSVVSNGPYPDVMDLPYSHHHHDHSLHTLESSFISAPRKLSRHSYEDRSVSPLTYDQSALNARCYSALNLAMSEAASNAFSHPRVRRATTRYPSLPNTPMLNDEEPYSRFSHSHDARRLRRLMAAHRGAYHSLEGAGDLSGRDPSRYQYHAAKLEKYLQEYRGLQQRAYRMKGARDIKRRASTSSRLSVCQDNLDAGLVRSGSASGVTSGCISSGIPGGIPGVSLFHEASSPSSSQSPYMEVDLGLPRSSRRARSLVADPYVNVVASAGSLSCRRDSRRGLRQSSSLTTTDAVMDAIHGDGAISPTDYMIDVMQESNAISPTESIIDVMRGRSHGPSDVVMDVMKGRSLGANEPRGDVQQGEVPRPSEPLRSILKNRYEGGGRLYKDQYHDSTSYYDHEDENERREVDMSYSPEYKVYLNSES